MIVSVYQCNCAYTYIVTYINMYMDAIYVCSVLRIHFFMHLSNYAPFVCLPSLVCARVHLYIHICVYIHIRLSLRFSRFWGFRLGTYAFDVSISFGIKSNRLRRNMPFLLPLPALVSVFIKYFNQKSQPAALQQSATLSPPHLERLHWVKASA